MSDEESAGHPGVSEMEEIVHKSLKRTAKARDIAATAKLLEAIKSSNLKDPEVQNLVNILDCCFSSQNFLKTEKSKKFLTNLALAFMCRIAEMATSIKQKLANTTEPIATSMGEVFVNTWLTADASERAALEMTILKSVIEYGILSAAPAMNRNCRAFMEAFHQKRRRKDLSATMTHIYRPVIFRYMHAANPVVRYNAMVMFVSAFPLESPQFSAEKKAELQEQQIRELHLALRDDSPKLRIAAAKAVCRILYEWWDFVPPGNRLEFAEILTHELCFDQSSSSVRLAVLEGIAFLVGRVESIDIVLPEVADMSYLLHDPVEAVRRQFVKLLTTLSPLNNVNIFTFVHFDHLLYRMKCDTPKCALAICELFLPSVFPPLTNVGKQQQLKTTRVSRVVFLMKRNLMAAVKFYTLLPKLVSAEDVLMLLSYSYYWATRIVQGRSAKLQSGSIVEDQDMVLPGFGDEDDLERQGMKPHQAIWAVISVTMCAIAKSGFAEEELAEIREKTFPNFDARKWLTELPPSLHSYFFRFIAVFKPQADEIAMTLEYLQDEENAAWSEALRCLVQWKSLATFFPELVLTVETISVEGGSEERIRELSRAIRYLSFIFSKDELRSSVIEDIDNIKRLVTGLEQFVTLLFLRLNIPFEEAESVGEQSMTVAEQLTNDSYICAIELTIALRVHLSLHMLQMQQESRDRNDDFTASVRMIQTSVFTPVTQGIMTSYNSDDLSPPNLPFMTLESLFTLIADMISLHVFDGEAFSELIPTFSDAMDTQSAYGEHVKMLGYRCVSKIVACISSDPVSGKEHPASDLLHQMVSNIDFKDAFTLTKQTIESLVRQQMKSKNLPWLHDTLSDLAIDCGDEDEEEEEAHEDDNDSQVTSLHKDLHRVIIEAIVKISN